MKYFNIPIVFYSLFFLAFLHLQSKGQSKQLLKVVKWERKNNALDIYSKGGMLQLIPYLDRTVQVKFGNVQGLSKLTNYGVISLPPLSIAFDTKETKDVITLKTSFYSIHIEKSNSC